MRYTLSRDCFNMLLLCHLEASLAVPRLFVHAVNKEPTVRLTTTTVLRYIARSAHTLVWFSLFLDVAPPKPVWSRRRRRHPRPAAVRAPTGG